jgi:hypothetical protein
MRRHLQELLGRLAAVAGHSVRLGRIAGRYVPGWAGAALVSFGAWSAWHPAGLIVAGLFLLAADALIPSNRHRGEG